MGDLGLIPGLGRSPAEGNGYPPQYSGLENSMDGIVHGVAKSLTQLNDFQKICIIYLFNVTQLPVMKIRQYGTGTKTEIKINGTG